jgi:hypothetical protein
LSKPASNIMSNLKYKKNWIEGKNKKEKLNLQKNSKHKKKTKKINFQRTR